MHDDGGRRERRDALDPIIEDLHELTPADLKVVQDTLAALKKAPIDHHRFLIDFWGIEVLDSQGDVSRARMPITPQVLNPLRIVHGGATYTLADTVMGFAAWRAYQGEKACVTVEIKISYIAPGRGKELVAEARVLRRGRTLTYVECRIADDQGRLVATATGTFFAWDPARHLPD